MVFQIGNRKLFSSSRNSSLNKLSFPAVCSSLEDLVIWDKELVAVKKWVRSQLPAREKMKMKAGDDMMKI